MWFSTPENWWATLFVMHSEECTSVGVVVVVFVVVRL